MGEWGAMNVSMEVYIDFKCKRWQCIVVWNVDFIIHVISWKKENAVMKQWFDVADMKNNNRLVNCFIILPQHRELYYNFMNAYIVV